VWHSEGDRSQPRPDGRRASDWRGPEPAQFTFRSREAIGELLPTQAGLPRFLQEFSPVVWRMAAGQHGLKDAEQEITIDEVNG
jgi:hypothetical protein